MSGRAALKKFDLSPGVYYRYVTHTHVNFNMTPSNLSRRSSYKAGFDVGVNGRKRILEVSELSGVQEDIREGAFSLASLDTDEVKVEMQKTILKKKGMNSHANLDEFAPISDKTVKAYIKDLSCTEVKGKVQATSRVEPFNDIKNCIAKAAGMWALNGVVDEQHFHSDDEVGIFLFGWGKDAGKPKLVVCEISNAWLKDHNISASRSEDPNQQRVVHIGTTQQPSTGELTCFYCRIVDSNFPDDFRHDDPEERKPRIFCLNEREHVYAVCCHHEVTDEVVFEYIGKYIISRAIADFQEMCVVRDIKCARLGTDAGQIFGEGSYPDVEIDEAEFEGT